MRFRATAVHQSAADMPSAAEGCVSFQESYGTTHHTWSVDGSGGLTASSPTQHTSSRAAMKDSSAAPDRPPNARLRLQDLLTHRVRRFVHTTFLPEGFPRSVGPDYVAYQTYDVTQALCAAVTGTLSTRAVLAGVGVGEQSATVVSGTLQWIIRDGTGMLSRIVFASRVASDLDNDMKRWRIAADVCNDVGVMLEIACSMFPRTYFVPLVCSAAVIKAVTAVAGQATRSTMAQHFQRRDNMADISAKNASQETAVSFLGMFLGMVVAAFVPPTVFYNTLVYVVVTVLHLYFNIVAIRTLVLTHFNQARLDIAICKFLEQHEGGGEDMPRVPTPDEMRHLEGLLVANPFWPQLPVPPHRVTLGGSLAQALQRRGAAVSRRPTSTKAEVTQRIVAQVQQDSYAILRHSDGHYDVLLGRRTVSPDILRAYVTLQLYETTVSGDGSDAELQVILPDDTLLERRSRFLAVCESRGWRMDRAMFKLQEWRVAADESV